jgi:hypothetical protein
VIVVVSTGLAASTREKCLASVRGQVGVDFRHIYVEASDMPPGVQPRPQMQNFYEAAHLCAPDDIIACVDGDDWLATPHALAAVQRMHDAGAWVTYGNFEYSDGRPSQMPECRVPWRQGWLSHLKTFRAALFQRIPADYFRVPRWDCTPDGVKYTEIDWCLYQDGAMMSAVAEMAGPSRVTYCKDVLYVYHAASSFEFNASQEEKAKQAYHVAHYRRMPTFERVDRL